MTTTTRPRIKPKATGEQTSRSEWLELRLASDMFARAQAERIACSNLIRSAAVDPALLAADHLKSLSHVENEAKLMMRRCYRRVAPPELRTWQESSAGVGEDSFARILGRLGDPLIAIPCHWEGTGDTRVLIEEELRERTVGQLWAYAGHGDASRRPTKGMTAQDMFALGSPQLKMLVHLQAEWCMRAPLGTRYREVYLDARAAVLDKVHSVECVRCGPKGRPAQIGSPWSDGHRHAHALRIVGKELLRDMWRVRYAAEHGVTFEAAAEAVTDSAVSRTHVLTHYLDGTATLEDVR